MNILIDPVTGRLRAGWRLVAQLILMIAITTGVSFVAYLLQLDVKGSGTIALFAGITVSVWVAGFLVDRRPFSAYGLALSPAFWRDYAAGWLITLLMQGFIVLLFLWSDTISPEALKPEFPVLANGAFWGLFAMMLMVGFHEELWTRGYQLLNLTEGFTTGSFSGPKAAMAATLLTSSLFGVLHAGNPNATVFAVVNIVLAGAWLALPYLLTGRLALSIGMHSGWNFVMGGVFGLPISGVAPTEGASLMRLQPEGQEWLTGGAFGPEGGLAGILALLFGTLLVLVYFRIIRQNTGLHPMFTSPPNAAEPVRIE